MYWFVFRPKTAGVQCLVEYKTAFLVVRNTYGKQKWTVPGGGIHRNETKEEAVRREVLEEVGIAISAVEYMGSFFSDAEHKKDTVHCFYATAENEAVRVDNIEIAEARWCAASDIPTPRSGSLGRVLGLYEQWRKHR